MFDRDFVIFNLQNNQINVSNVWKVKNKENDFSWSLSAVFFVDLQQIGLIHFVQLCRTEKLKDISCKKPTTLLLENILLKTF